MDFNRSLRQLRTAVWGLKKLSVFQSLSYIITIFSVHSQLFLQVLFLLSPDYYLLILPHY